MTVAAIDRAVLSHLQADTTLRGLAPGGVWSNVAPEGAVDRGVFVIVQLQAHEDIDQQSDVVALEVPRFMAKAVDRSADGAGAIAAASRIHELLQSVPLTIAGYQWMDTRREQRLSYTEKDSAVYWKHEGGVYRVEAHPV